MRNNKMNHTLSISVSLVMLCLILGSHAWADTLETTEHRITASTASETTPTLGNDGTRDLVVFTVKPLVDGVQQAADIWYQPLVDGAPSGMPVQVTSGPTHDQLNDVSGDYIVFTAFESLSSDRGAITLYQISTGLTHELGSAAVIREPRIHGGTVVWIEGGESATMVMRYKLAWIGTDIKADILAGPVPPTFEIQIGSRFAVWSEFNSGQYDIFAYDLDSEIGRRITSTPAVDENAPATSGAWIVWQQKAHGETATTIQAYNQDTHESRTIVDNGARNINPSIDGDLIAWESDVAGNLDIWLYRMSTGETFQVTSEANHQYLNDVFGDMVAYVDMRRGSEDVYVSHLEFIPDNQLPLADAGTDQTVHAGSLVTLDGTGSTDPDGNLPLTYAWTIVSMPAGSGASLSDPTSATPSFVADKYGEYLLSLTVTDSLGLPSTADDVLISTSNSAPFADAGADQAVVLVGTNVHLDGSGSYDPDGDPITYQWSFISTPAGSTATLDGATTATPSFLADKYGTYEIQLVVADPWASTADTVVVSFNNVAPVADAGTSGTAVVDETVTLDGRASYDANGDALTYQWGFTSLPEGSTAAIFEPTAAATTFVPDLPGLYVVQLVVSDGMFNSDPSTIQVQVISQQSAAVNAINMIIESVGSLEPGDLKNANMQNALINKLNAVIASIEAGSYADALDKLQNDLLKKTDGCATGGEPDKNDWIKNCDAQAEVYPFIVAAIATIDGL